MDVNEIRSALAALFTDVHRYTTATAPVAPCVVVHFPTIEFDKTFGGVADLSFTLSIGTSTQDETAAERWLGDQISAVRNTVQLPHALWRSSKVQSTGKPYSTEVGTAIYRWVDVQVLIHSS